MRYRVELCVLSLLLVLTLTPPALAIDYVYSTIDFPGSITTTASGINDNGVIVGTYGAPIANPLIGPPPFRRLSPISFPANCKRVYLVRWILQYA